MNVARVTGLLASWALAASAGWCADSAAGVSVRSVGRLLQSRAEHTATLLGDGRVLACGGSTLSTWAPLASCEIFDPVSEQWSGGTDLHLPRAGHAAQRLRDGSVLLVGGFLTHYSAPTNTAELWRPESGTSELVGRMATPHGYGLRLYALDDGRVLAIGGMREGVFGASAARIEVFDPPSRRFEEWGRLVLSRRQFGICRLSLTELAILGGTYGFPDRNAVLRREGSWERLNLETGHAELGGLLPRGVLGAGVEASPSPSRALTLSVTSDRIVVGRPGDWEELDLGCGLVDNRGFAALSDSVVLVPCGREYRAFDSRTGRPLLLDGPLPAQVGNAVTPLGNGCALVSGGTNGVDPRATDETWMVCSTTE